MKRARTVTSLGRYQGPAYRMMANRIGMAQKFARYSKYANFARGAYRLGSFAMRNRGSIMSAAARMKRSFQAKQRAKIGDRIGTSSARRDLVVEDNTAINTRTLYFAQLDDISEGTGNNQRMRDQLNIRGFRIFMNVTNNTGNAVYFNFAVVSCINQDQPTTFNFFRSYGTPRAVTFSTSLTSTDFHFRPINTDEYAVLSHKRFHFGSAPSTGNLGSTSHYKQILMWVPVKRQQRYDTEATSGTAELSQKKIYKCFWCDTNNTGASALPVTTLQYISKVVVYFRNTRD